MKHFIYPFLAIGLLTLTTSVSGSEYEQLLQTQRLLEDRVTLIARSYDAKAFAIVNIRLKKKTVELPGAPFYFEDFTLTGADQPDIERIEARIVSRLNNLPSEAIDLARESLRSFSPRVEITQSRIPTSKESTPEFQLQLPQGSGLLDLVATTPVAFGICSFFLLLLGVAGYSLFAISGRLKTSAGSVSNSLNQGLNALKESLESGGSLSGSEDPSSASGMAASGGGTLSFESYRPESCVALLSDCYWCQHDGYASYIWSQLSQEKRAASIGIWPQLEKYVRHFQSVAPVDFGLQNDVNYLKPLPVWHLDNSALTIQARSFPAILSGLSPLRSESLDLGISERLQLQSRASATRDLPNFSSLPPSPDRTLRSFAFLKLVKESSETEALSLRALAPEAKEQFVTLAWMIQLPKEKVAEILERFTARELASAWIGPNSLLVYLSECLSPKKLALLESYKKTVKPSRDSAVFSRLHGATVESLKQLSNESSATSGPLAQAA